MENLPRYFALKSLSNNKYLRYIHEEDVALHGHVEFSGEEVISLYTKYEMEPVMNEANKGLFNIRCCHNNKYWMKRRKNTSWITASAAEPVEDQLKWSSTQFQPTIEVSDHGNSMLRLRHVQNGEYLLVSVGSRDPTYRSCIKADANPPVPSSEGDSNTSTAFSIMDWESFVILPELVMIKGDNGAYLSSEHNTNILKFDSNDAGLDKILHKILYTRDGLLWISTRYLWTNIYSISTHQDYLIYDNPPRTVVEPSIFYSLFRLVKGHGDNEVAIQNFALEKFCQRVIVEFRKNSLSPTANSSMVKEAVMMVQEPAISRSIYNVNFCLKHARIYNKSDVTVVSKQFTNPLDVNEDIQLTQTFTKETIRTWNSIVTLKLATSTKIESRIPLIVDGEVGLWHEFEG